MSEIKSGMWHTTKSSLLPADRFKQEFSVSDFPQTKNKVHEKCYAKGLQGRS